MLARHVERKMAVPMPSKRRSLVVQTSMDAYTPPGDGALLPHSSAPLCQRRRWFSFNTDILEQILLKRLLATNVQIFRKT